MKKIIFFCALTSSFCAFAEKEYDQEMLKSLGYSADAADLLKASAHFLPGNQPVNVSVNGKSKGVHLIEFDSSGLACWPEALLRQSGVDPKYFNDNGGAACLRPTVDGGVQEEARVDRNSLALLVPVGGILADTQYETGGKAVVVNYDGRHYLYQSRSGGNHSSQTLTTEVGANINQWIFRSGQSYTSRDNDSSFNRLYSYGQRSIPGWASVVQLGEITSNDPLFAGIPLTGAQIMPENTSRSGNASQVSLDTLIPQEGTVEVWQGNILLKTFQVSAGMNRLDGIPALNRYDDFVIVSHDSAGTPRQHVIPYIQARTDVALTEEGISLAAGQLRLTQQVFPLLLGSTSIYQNNTLAVMAGGLVSEAYQAASWRSGIRLTDRLLATVSQTYSLAHNIANNNAKKAGESFQASLAYPVTSQLSLTTTANFRSRDYVDVSSSWSSQKTASEAGQVKSQYAAGMSYNHPLLGALSFSGSMAQTWKGTETLGYLFGWGKTFGGVNVNLGIQKSWLSDNQHKSDDRFAYLNVSIPLGHNRSLRSWVSGNGQSTRAGVGYDQAVNDQFSWSLSSEKSQQQEPSVASSATWTNKYSQLSGGISHSERNNNYNLGARGGAVLHEEGFTFTPRKVGDTFGIISLSSNHPDIEIRTPTGKVWSDASGHAIASWMPWQKNTVQISNKSLPKNVQVITGIADVTPYRGSVVPVTLPALTVRRTLLTFPTDEGPVSGSAIKNAKGALIAFVNEDGTLFLDDLPEGQLFGHLKSGTRCSIELTSPWVDVPDTLYASLSARCVL